MGFSASGKKIYLARQFNIEIYDLDGDFEKDFYVSSTKYPITLVDSINQDRLLVVGDSTGPVWIIDAETERQQGMFFKYNSHNPLVRFALSPSGSVAVMVLKKGQAHIWRIGEESSRFLPQILHQGAVEIVLFKPAANEETWLTAGEDGVARLWSLRDGQVEPGAIFDHDGEAIGYATFTENPPRLATFTYSGKNRVWDTATGSLLISP